MDYKDTIQHMIDIYQARFNYLEASLQKDLSKYTLADMAKKAEQITMCRQLIQLISFCQEEG